MAPIFVGVMLGLVLFASSGLSTLPYAPGTFVSSGGKHGISVGGDCMSRHDVALLPRPCGGHGRNAELHVDLLRRPVAGCCCAWCHVLHGASASPGVRVFYAALAGHQQRQR